ncbi:MAG: DUF6259 domain-containing protein [Clostridiales bacterium]|jgi:hypothetical protein|nr:DUF6259 domain-containing protein [Clostridiales bacterium]
MKIANKHYELTLDETTGRILSYKRPGNAFDYAAKRGAPLVSMRLIYGKSGRRVVESGAALRVFDDKKGAVTVSFSAVGGENIGVKVFLRYDDGPYLGWSWTLENRTDALVEWVDCPGIAAPNDLIEGGGRHRLMLPLFEGVELDGFTARNKYFPYRDADYPSRGWEGVYPGGAPVPFMAYYDGEEGLYVGAHDRTAQYKAVDCFEDGDALRFLCKVFPGTAHKNIEPGYEYVTALYAGDWYDAAEIYRRFVYALSPAALQKSPFAPAWADDSPLVVIYPIRGEKDTGDLSDNPDYYPYTNALPHINRLAAETGSRLLVLLCHWEGTAPWCPPFVWPPYGGTENFSQFAQKLRDGGHLLGLYCSGIGWTQRSKYLPSYTRERFFDEQGLARSVCRAYDGEKRAVICVPGIREGYDLCAYCADTRALILAELDKILDSGCVDYVQLFDQNIGGLGSVCYADDHGHPAVPGRWLTEAMRELLGLAAEKAAQKNAVLGCEGVAAEPFMEYLPFNDSRNYPAFAFGRAVPAYNYVYKRAASNFMGNQNTSAMYLYSGDNPQSVFYRTAHFFAQGDMLTLTLKDGGKINWDWGTPWAAPEVEQTAYLRFVRDLNAWRKTRLREAFTVGEMTKPLPVDCGRFTVRHYRGAYPLYASKAEPSLPDMAIDYPSIITTAWRVGAKKSQVFVNFDSREQTFCVKSLPGKMRVCSDLDAPETEIAADGARTFRIAPYGVIKLEWDSRS